MNLYIRFENVPHDILQFRCTWKKKKKQQIDLIYQLHAQAICFVLVQFQNEKSNKSVHIPKEPYSNTVITIYKMSSMNAIRHLIWFC